MIEIPYHASGFPSYLHGTLSGDKTLTVGWEHILWAAITVGRRDLEDVFSNGEHSYYEALYRALIVYANLKQSGTRLEYTEAFRRLDSSEKGAVTYFLGMTFGKLFAANYLGVPYMMHLSTYKDKFEPVRFRTSKRPDLFGFDQDNHLIVMEAKGRTRRVRPALMAKAKSQTKSLRRLAGMSPSLKVASACYFAAGRLEVRLDDPDGENPATFDVSVSLDDVIRDYYRGFVDWIDAVPNAPVEKFNGRSLQLVELPPVGLRVGVDVTVLATYSKSKEFYADVVGKLPPTDQPLSPDRRRRPSPPDDNEIVGEGEEVEQATSNEFLHYYGPDGIAVWLDTKYWGNNVMKWEPVARQRFRK